MFANEGTVGGAETRTVSDRGRRSTKFWIDIISSMTGRIFLSIEYPIKIRFVPFEIHDISKQSIGNYLPKIAKTKKLFTEEGRTR